jgi:GTP-binding protein Era
MSQTEEDGQNPPPEIMRSGYVALVGRPNVGKSTLMNRILGQKLSIVTAKPQTTRQRICGIKSHAGGQVVYVDTPGIHHAAGKALNRYMNRIARASFLDVDAILFLVEAGHWTRQDESVARSLETLGTPTYLVVNKIDRVAAKADLLSFLEKHGSKERFTRVFLVSALKGDGTNDLEKVVSAALPFSKPFYDEDQFTDRSERFLAAELVREQLMQRLHQELPYAMTVEIESFERERALLRIGAVIWVERQSQKQIVIGKGGEALKQAGTRARLALEEFFGQKVFLKTWVRVSRNWSNDERLLKKLGYDEAT